MRAGQEFSTIILVLRRLRGTLIALVVIYAVSVLGLTLVPGPTDASGAVTRMGFFHAFYFVSYTATTIGFGEIPNAFSEQQRLWTIVCIYLSVIGWAVFIGKLLQLAADDNLQRALRASRFARSVSKLREPFYIVCGYGETGRLICAALDRMGLRVVVLELSSEHLAELELTNHSADMPALAADAANPTLLKQAGLQHPLCRGIVTLTNDDQANRAIALAARLLAPERPVLARASSATTAEDMASFGTDHIIDPFMKFSGYLDLALHGPAAYQLLLWLTGLPGTVVQRHRHPPHGRWILLGYGRFSQALASTIVRGGMEVTVIDLLPCPDRLADGVHWVQGDGTTAPALERAGVRTAAGIIAATSNDIDNLSACYTARERHPGLFTIVRQNEVANQPLFVRFHADLSMVPSEVIAHECLAILTTPMLAPFLQAAQQQPQGWCEALLQRLTGQLSWDAPEVWSVRISPTGAPALHRRLRREPHMRLGELLRDHANRSERLLCEVLQLDRPGQPSVLLPDPNTVLAPGDECLLVGRRSDRSRLELVLRNEHALDYVLTGREPSGWLWQKLQQK